MKKYNTLLLLLALCSSASSYSSEKAIDDVAEQNSTLEIPIDLINETDKSLIFALILQLKTTTTTTENGIKRTTTKTKSDFFNIKLEQDAYEMKSFPITVADIPHSTLSCLLEIEGKKLEVPVQIKLDGNTVLALYFEKNGKITHEVKEEKTQAKL